MFFFFGLELPLYNQWPPMPMAPTILDDWKPVPVFVLSKRNDWGKDELLEYSLFLEEAGKKLNKKFVTTKNSLDAANAKYGLDICLIKEHTMSSLGRKGADARHKETRDFKRDARMYYHKHGREFKNKDEAAQHIADKEIPGIAPATVRDWLKGIKA